MRRALSKFAPLAWIMVAVLALVALRLSLGGPDMAAILGDRDAPVGGDPQGDLTIVDFFDYQCPYCRRAEAALDEFAREDGHVRIIYKDWPILGEASTQAARRALAARDQGKYLEAHRILFAMAGRRATPEQIDAALSAAGVDLARLTADLAAHGGEIDALLARNLVQAASLGLQGTPAFLIGPVLTPQALDLEGFRAAAVLARAAKP